MTMCIHGVKGGACMCENLDTKQSSRDGFNISVTIITLFDGCSPQGDVVNWLPDGAASSACLCSYLETTTSDINSCKPRLR